MTPAARLAAAAGLLDGLDLSRPVESQLRHWARANRYAGSKDRRAIADRVYDCLRRRRSLAARMGADDGRALVLASLIDCDGLSAAQAVAACGGTYGLAPPDAGEERRLAATLEFVSDGARHDWPDFLLEPARAAFGDDWRPELDALRSRAPLDLRTNASLIERAALLERLAAHGLSGAALALTPWAIRLAPGQPVAATPEFEQGLFEMQDAGSQAVSLFSDAQPGETVLDFCAGGGGKTLALGAMMQNRGRLIAYDIAAERMAELPERAARARLSSLEVQSDPARLAELAGACDCVFIDAPCSGSGSWRRDPVGKWALTEQRFADLRGIQRDALVMAARFVRPGGRLVYATCSVFEEENERPVADFLRGAPEFAAEGRLRLHPARDACDGFFAARLRRHRG